MLNILVHNACEQLPNDGLVKCIAILLSGSIFDEKSNLYKIPHSQNGNHLHHAAARGHKDLVKVLLESGMKQTHPCKHRRAPNVIDCNKGVNEYPHPIDWAYVRGQREIVELLEAYRSRSEIDDTMNYEWR